VPIFVGITIGGFIETSEPQNLQWIYSKLSPFGCIDRPGESLDHDGDPLGLARRQSAARKRRGDGLAVPPIEGASDVSAAANALATEELTSYRTFKAASTSSAMCQKQTTIISQYLLRRMSKSR
jgi:hypothetical protein